LPYTVKVDHPSAGDQDVYIHGLGTFHNGTETEVDDDQVMRYRIATGRQLQGVFNDAGDVVAPHDENGRSEVRFELGPEPHELEFYGVTVTKKEEKPSTKTATPKTSNTGEGGGK
jgi:hypothetical protein